MRLNELKFVASHAKHAPTEATETIRHTLHTFLLDLKVASTIAIAAIVNWIASLFDLLPEDVNDLTGFLGAVLTLVVIVVHLFNLRKNMLEYKKLQIEMERERLLLEKHKKEAVQVKQEEQKPTLKPPD